MPRAECRPINWRHEPTPEAKVVGSWYAEQTRHQWAEDDDWYVVTALPDDESRGEP